MVCVCVYLTCMPPPHTLVQLVAILPAAAVGRQWVLVYSTFRDGISLRTMYRNMVAFENEDSPVVLVVRDDQLKVSMRSCLNLHTNNTTIHLHLHMLS